MEEKILFWEAFFMILFVPARNYLFKVSHWRAKIRCESCLRLIMKILERCQWRHSCASIVNCEYISSFVLIVEFEQANLCLVHIEKTNSFKNKIGYIIRYVAVFSVWTKFINKQYLNLYLHNPSGESVRNFSKGVYFRRWSWLKRDAAHFQNNLPLHFYLFTDFARWMTNTRFRS